MNKFVVKNYPAIIIIFILIVCFINANSIVLFFTPSLDELVLVDADGMKESSNIPIMSSLEEFTVNENIQHTVKVSGWAFCESTLKNPKREVGVLFESLSGNTPDYSVCVPATQRNDVLETFQGQLNDPMTGIETEFSVTKMIDGIYKLYLYSIENNTLTGMEFTNCYYQKNALSFEKVNYIPEENNLQAAIYNPNLITTIEEQGVYADTLNITGWGFISDEDSHSQKIYVKFIHSEKESFSYQLLPHLRADITKAYNNDMYELSGFTINIPLKELPFIPEKFEIVIELDNTLYTNSVTYDIPMA